MTWYLIDSKADLKRLTELVCWEDAEVVELYAKSGHEPFFPSDVCRSGYSALNFYLLCRAPLRDVEYVELVLIDCEWFTFGFLHNPFFEAGRVDSLKRVEIWDYQKSTLMRCARLIYCLHGPDARIRPGYLAERFAPREGIG